MILNVLYPLGVTFPYFMIPDQLHVPNYKKQGFRRKNTLICINYAL